MNKGAVHQLHTKNNKTAKTYNKLTEINSKS